MPIKDTYKLLLINNIVAFSLKSNQCPLLGHEINVYRGEKGNSIQIALVAVYSLWFFNRCNKLGIGRCQPLTNRLPESCFTSFLISRIIKVLETIDGGSLVV